MASPSTQRRLKNIGDLDDAYPRTSTTLTQFLIEQRRRYPDASGNFNALILDVALACKAIAKSVAYGALADLLGNHPDQGGTSVNVQGETQKNSMCSATICSSA